MGRGQGSQEVGGVGREEKYGEHVIHRNSFKASLWVHVV